MSLTKRYEVSVAAAQEMYRAVFYADMEASIAAEFDETPLSKDLDCMKQKIKKALEQITGGLAAMKLTEEKIMNCEMCGKVMEHPRWQQKYCGAKCRKKAQWRRCKNGRNANQKCD